MSRSQRLALFAGALVVLIAAFVILRPSDEEEPATQANTNQSAPADTTADGGATQSDVEPPAQPKPTVTRIRIRGGDPVGGEADVEVTKGDRIRLAISSDVADEVHVHGYDLSREVGPGRPARISFVADIEGGFEVELEERAVPIAQIEVNP